MLPVVSLARRALSIQPRFGLTRHFSHGDDKQFRATTILSVRKGGMVAVIGDGQVSRGSEVVKNNG